jgi:hypothetical protein
LEIAEWLAENAAGFRLTRKDNPSENEHVEPNSPRTPNANAETGQFHLLKASISLLL